MSPADHPSIVLAPHSPSFSPANSPSRSQSSGTTVHVIADSDTRWKWGAALAHRLGTEERPGIDERPGTDDGATPTVVGYLLAGRATPTDRQLADVGAAATAVRRVGIGDVLDTMQRVDSDQLVVLACVGGTIQTLLHGLARSWADRSDRPVVVTGYVGLVYERLVDGLLLRAGADVVLANSVHDAERFRDVYRAVGADADSIVQTALPFLGGAAHDPFAAGRDRPFTVCFATQPTVPAGRDDRRHALQCVIDHATRHPGRHVILKLRARPGEQTTHREPHHYAGLLPADALPGNVEIAYGSMSAVLDRTDLCVTISSTAALEALHRAIPTAVLTDFGVREGLGNQLFLGSGVLTSWRALDDGWLPVAEPAWLARNGVVDRNPYLAARQRIAELAGRPLPALQPWFTERDFAAYLPGLLARNGLDPQGRPLLTPAVLAQRGPVRRAARTAARAAYRFGLTTVEPALRRWTQL